eukprot:TRINITY_DN9005_c0_g1_i2.p1 TRINITY_DN9005_c0_g1~~TRINITY_DN9005_c0_g1_i2.p1  ORF type:complete len:383 (+),score=109.04 TRINITY_DN9005_c0_g1_i2:63-1211(+)
MACVSATQRAAAPPSDEHVSVLLYAPASTISQETCSVELPPQRVSQGCTAAELVASVLGSSPVLVSAASEFSFRLICMGTALQDADVVEPGFLMLTGPRARAPREGSWRRLSVCVLGMILEYLPQRAVLAAAQLSSPLRRLSRRCIRRLRVSLPKQLPAHSAHASAKRMLWPSLTSLDLSDSTIPDSTLAALSHSCRELRELDLTGCYNLTSLAALDLPQLRVLKVSGCSRLGADLPSPAELPKLEVVELQESAYRGRLGTAFAAVHPRCKQERVMTLHVRGGGTCFSMHGVRMTATLADLRRELSRCCKVEPGSLLLVYNQRLLDPLDSSTLLQKGFGDESLLFVTYRVRGAAVQFADTTEHRRSWLPDGGGGGGPSAGAW